MARNMPERAASPWERGGHIPAAQSPEPGAHWPVLQGRGPGEGGGGGESPGGKASCTQVFVLLLCFSLKQESLCLSASHTGVRRQRFTVPLPPARSGVFFFFFLNETGFCCLAFTLINHH